MAKTKKYRVVDKLGVVGFKGVIHANGDVINGGQVPPANLKAWLHFGQVEEIEEKAETPKSESEKSEAPSEKKGKKS